MVLQPPAKDLNSVMPTSKQGATMLKLSIILLHLFLLPCVYSEECEPMEEGKEYYLTCSDTGRCTGAPLAISWKTSDNEVLGNCTTDWSERTDYPSKFQILCDDQGMFNFVSSIRIFEVGRSSLPITLLQKRLICEYCGARSTSVPCDSVQIFARPEAVSLTLQTDQFDENGILTGITLTCVSGKSFPEAFCRIIHVKDNEFSEILDVSLDHQSSEVSGFADVYYRSEQNGTVSLERLGPGSHYFYAQVYPDVRNGINYFTETGNTNTVTLSAKPEIISFNGQGSVSFENTTPTLTCTVSTSLRMTSRVAISNANTGEEVVSRTDGESLVHTLPPLTCTSEEQKYVCTAENIFGKTEQSLSFDVGCSSIRLASPNQQDAVFYTRAGEDIEVSVSTLGRPGMLDIQRNGGSLMDPMFRPGFRFARRPPYWVTDLTFENMAVSEFGEHSLHLEHVYGSPGLEDLVWRFEIKNLDEIKASSCNETAPIILDLSSTITNCRMRYCYAVQHVECIVGGNPTPNVSLLMDGQELTVDEETSESTVTLHYSIERRKRPCTGRAEKYSCIAENALGRVERNRSLDIVECPIETQDDSKSTFHAVLGDRLVGSFTVSGYPNPTTFILKKGSQTAEVDNSRYSIKSYSTESDPLTHLVTLTIPSMEKEDFATYTLHIENDYSSNGADVSFDVVEMEKVTLERAPTVTEFYATEDGETPKETFKKGDDVILHCEAQGNPVPTISFFRQSTGALIRRMVGESLDYRIDVDCTGVVEEFLCVAENDIGGVQEVQQRSTTVIRHCPLQNTGTGSTPTFYSLPGDNLETSFFVTGYPGPSTYTLLKDSSSPSTVDQSRYRFNSYSNKSAPLTHLVTLTILSMSDADFTTYTLRLDNGASEEVEVAFKAVEVKRFTNDTAPTVDAFYVSDDGGTRRGEFLAGESVTLSCQVQGTPQPTISLEQLSGEDAVLATINGRQLEHTIDDLQCIGETVEFLCLVKNSIGTARKTTSVVIQCPLQLKGTENGQTFTSFLHADASISFLVAGYPGPTTYTLTKGANSLTVSKSRYQHNSYINSQLRTEHLVTITINNVENDDFDSYHIAVGNGIGGEATLLFNLEQSTSKKSPNIVEFSSYAGQTRRSTFQDGTTVTLRCRVEANPEPTISLKRRSTGELLSSTTGVTSEHRLADTECTGVPEEFVCEAVNSEGTAQKVTSIIVQCALTSSPSQQDKETYAQPGESATILFTAFGYPEPSTFELFKGPGNTVVAADDYQMDISTKFDNVQRRTQILISIVMKSLDDSDFVSYRLRVGNEAGSDIELNFVIEKANGSRSNCFAYSDGDSDKLEMDMPVVAGVFGAAGVIIIILAITAICCYRRMNANPDKNRHCPPRPLSKAPSVPPRINEGNTSGGTVMIPTVTGQPQIPQPTQPSSNNAGEGRVRSRTSTASTDIRRAQGPHYHPSVPEAARGNQASGAERRRVQEGSDGYLLYKRVDPYIQLQDEK